MADESEWLERCDPKRRYVFPNVYWKRKDERAARSVTLVLDAPKALLEIEVSRSWDTDGIDGEEPLSPASCYSAREDAFMLSEIVMQCAFRNDDSSTRSKIIILPWHTVLLRSNATDAKQGAKGAKDNGLSTTTSQTASNGPSLAAGPGAKAGWVLLMAKPDACRFARIATSAGVIQQGFSSTWRITSYAGSGGFADVYVAKGPHGAQGAAKLIKPAFSTLSVGDAKKSWGKFAEEIAAIRVLQDSPYFPQIFGAFFMSARGEGTTTTNLCLVMQYLEVDLKVLRSEELFTERQLRPILRDLLRGLQHMHAKSYAHRDVKISNVMLKTVKGPAFLIDYGFAVQVDPSVQERSIAGTPGYLAPELFRRAHWDIRPTDLFSLACLAYNLMSKILVFTEGGEEQVMRRNRRGRVKWEEAPFNASESLMQLLVGLFEIDASNRLTAEEALASPWFEPRPRCTQSTARMDLDLLHGQVQGEDGDRSLDVRNQGSEEKNVPGLATTGDLCGTHTTTVPHKLKELHSASRPYSEKPVLFAPELEVRQASERRHLAGVLDWPDCGSFTGIPEVRGVAQHMGLECLHDMDGPQLLDLEFDGRGAKQQSTTAPNITFTCKDAELGESVPLVELGSAQLDAPQRKRNLRIEAAATAPELYFEPSEEADRDRVLVASTCTNGLRDTLQDGILQHLRSAARVAAGKAKTSVTYFSRGFEVSMNSSRFTSEAFSRLYQNDAHHARNSPKSPFTPGHDRAWLDSNGADAGMKDTEGDWSCSQPVSPRAPATSPGNLSPNRIRRFFKRSAKDSPETSSIGGKNDFTQQTKKESVDGPEPPQQIAHRPDAERRMDAYRRPCVGPPIS